MEIRKIALPVVGVMSAAATYLGISGIHSTMNAPEHKKDIQDLEFFVSPEGNDARCAAEGGQAIGDKLKSLPEMTPEEADASAGLMNAAGADEMTGDDVQFFRRNKDALEEIPGYDCQIVSEGEEPEGASTYVVMKTIEKRTPFVIGGLLGMTGAVAFASGHYTARRRK